MHHLSPASHRARTPLARRILTVGLLATVALGSACSRGAANRSASTVAPRAVPADPTVRPGDRLSTKVYGEPTWSVEETTIDERGAITLPRIGTLRVAGLGATALRDTVRARYAKFLRDPDADVLVQRRVGVTGEVARPALYWVDVTTTTRELISLAGGVTEAGNLDDIAVVREGVRTPLPREALVTTPLDLSSGDQIVVGRRSWLARNSLAAASTFAVTVSVLITAFRR